MVETATGTLVVYGQVTAEDVDSDRELCDYEGTKPFYAAKVEQMRKATTELGVEPNIMPLREMHSGDKAAGRGISIEFNDAAKRIMMGFEVVDPLACQKVLKGMYPGLSQGGDYVDKWADPAQKGITRYIADPIEVSLVDAPACPTSLLSSVSEFEYEKADGSKEMRKFAKTLTPPAPATLGTLSEADVQRVAAAFAADQRRAARRAKIIAAAKAAGIAPAAEAKKLQAVLGSLRNMQKGMYQVGEMARLIEDLTYMQQSAVWERDFEQDGSEQPEDLMALLEEAIACFLSMAEEEAGEVAARAKESTATAKGATTMKIAPETLEKAIAEIEKAKDHAKAAHTAVTKAVDHHQKMAAHHAEMHKVHKAQMDAHEKMGKMHEAHAAMLGKAAEHTAAMCDGEADKGADPAKTGVQDPPAPAPAPPAAAAAVVPEPGLTLATVEDLVKTTVAAAVEGALVKALAELKVDSNDPANKTRMTLVPRPGDPAPVVKGASTGASETPTGTMKDSVGF